MVFSRPFFENFLQAMFVWHEDQKRVASCLLDSNCPAVEDIRDRHSRLFDNSHGVMRLFMWQSNQTGVASCLLQILD